MARGTNRLSATQVKNAASGSVVQDGGGLFLKKSQNGGRWFYRFQINGKRRDMGLGSYPDMSLSDARKERSKWAAIVERGEDPILERLKQRELAEAERSMKEPTFNEMFEIFFESYKDRLRNKHTQNKWKRPVQLHLAPMLGKRKITRISQREIYEALRPIWRSKHTTASKALNRARMVFKSAKFAGYDTDPFVCDAAGEMLGAVRGKAQMIPATPWAEIPDLYFRLSERSQTRFRAARFMLLTAARTEPIRWAKFSQIENGVWTVPEEHVKGTIERVKDFRIPLSVQAIELVEECRELARNDFLFPGTRNNKPIGHYALRQALNDVMEPGRPHGLRTSFRTWVQDTEAASFEVAETALAHIVGNKVERSYARSDLLDKRRVLMQKWADFVTQTESKILQLRG